jgi:hypothetical protein
MKQILLISMLAMATVSCTKSVQPEQIVNTRLESESQMTAYVGSGANSALVTVKTEPYVVCESYQDGETPKPCNIFISFTCTLSQPLSNSVRVEIERSNLVQVNPDPAAEGESGGSNPPIYDPGARISLIIPANTTALVFKSTLSCLNNNNSPENQFRIVSAGVYTPMN